MRSSQPRINLSRRYVVVKGPEQNNRFGENNHPRTRQGSFSKNYSESQKPVHLHAMDKVMEDEGSDNTNCERQIL